jgi:predicted ATP-dependent Lon-type protease
MASDSEQHKKAYVKSVKYARSNSKRVREKSLNFVSNVQSFYVMYEFCQSISDSVKIIKHDYKWFKDKFNNQING